MISWNATWNQSFVKFNFKVYIAFMPDYRRFWRIFWLQYLLFYKSFWKIFKLKKVCDILIPIILLWCNIPTSMAVYIFWSMTFSDVVYGYQLSNSNRKSNTVCINSFRQFTYKVTLFGRGGPTFQIKKMFFSYKIYDKWGKKVYKPNFCVTL